MLHSGNRLRQVVAAMVMLSLFTACSDDKGEHDDDQEPEGETFEIVMPAQLIPTGEEFGKFLYDDVGNDHDVYINRIKATISPGISGVFLSDFASTLPSSITPAVGEVRDLYDDDGNISDERQNQLLYYSPLLVANSSVDYSFPEGTAIKLSLDKKLDLALFGVNATSTPLSIEGKCELFSTHETIEHEVKPFYTVNFTVNVPPNASATVNHIFSSPSVMNIVMLKPFTHKFSTKVEVSRVGGSADGEIIYSTTDWQDPEVLSFEDPLVINAGEGIRLSVTYNNSKNTPLHFGVSADDDFTGMFWYYY